MSDVVLPIEKSSVIKSNYDFKVPYYPESDDCKVPCKSTPDADVYDLYAAEDKDISPRSYAIVSLDLRIAIPKVFFGKIFSRSGLYLNHKTTAEAGVIDSGYRGIVHVLLFDHSDEKFSVKVGQRIAQVVSLEKFDVKFEIAQSADSLPKSVRNENGFGSTGNYWLFFSEKKMASIFNQEILLKDNKINEEKFDAFPKEFFNGMLNQSLFLAFKLLHDKGERPGAGEFEKKLNDLTKEIMEEKIKLLEKI